MQQGDEVPGGHGIGAAYRSWHWDGKLNRIGATASWPPSKTCTLM